MELSYASGTSTTPLLGDTIGDNLDRTIARFGDREALVSVHQDLRYTYAQFGEAVDRCARALHGRRPRARRPRRDLVPQLRRVGARPVRHGQGGDHPRQHQPGLPDVRARLRAQASPAASCSSRRPPSRPPTTCRWSTRCAATSTPSSGSCSSGATGRSSSPAASGSAPRSSDERQAATQFDDPINIQYTSGTTGFPKGATLSHHNILNNGYFVGRGCRYTEADRVCIPVPYYHCFGMVMGNLACTTHGACMVIPAPAFDPVASLQAVQDEHCTSLYGVPTMFIAELEHPEFGEFDLSSRCVPGSWPARRARSRRCAAASRRCTWRR